MRSVTDFIRNNTPGGAYIMAGVPALWYTDMPPEMAPAFMECFDAISPWTVGAYSNQEDIDWFAQFRIRRDAEFIEKWKREKGKHVDYIPTVHPGGSVCTIFFLE
jgi:hypothetical protein